MEVLAAKLEWNSCHTPKNSLAKPKRIKIAQILGKAEIPLKRWVHKIAAVTCQLTLRISRARNRKRVSKVSYPARNSINSRI